MPASRMPSHSACKRQRREARVRLPRNDLAAAGAVIEILEDHRRIVEHGAVLDDQRGNLAERILLADASRRRRSDRPSRS